MNLFKSFVVLRKRSRLKTRTREICKVVRWLLLRFIKSFFWWFVGKFYALESISFHFALWKKKVLNISIAFVCFQCRLECRDLRSARLIIVETFLKRFLILSDKLVRDIFSRVTSWLTPRDCFAEEMDLQVWSANLNHDSMMRAFVCLSSTCN